MNKEKNSVSTQCDEIIGACPLLEHPFYKAWSNGTLPAAALGEYAREYGGFIRTIGRGWETLGKKDIARQEMSHFQIWERSFAKAFDPSGIGTPQVKEVVRLVDTANKLFDERAAAIGALYAFEAQQPLTAKSKLDGLKKYYRLPDSCGDYFKLHSDDYDETSMLTEMMDDLNESEQKLTLDACDSLSRALYSALTGIYAPYNRDC